MVAFEDKFDRADSATLGNGWVTLGDAVADAKILNTQLTNDASVSIGNIAVVQEGTSPTGWDQMVEAVVASTATSAKNIIGVGVYGRISSTNFDHGYGLLLSFDNATTYTLSLIRNNVTTGLTSYTVLATITVTPTTMLNFGHHLRLITHPVQQGMRVRGYVNEPDDDNPTLEFIDIRERVAATTRAYGDPYLYLRDAADMTLLCLAFAFEDYTATREVDATMEKDMLTRSEIRSEAKDYFGASNTTVSDTQLNRYINHTIAQILNEAGDDVPWGMPTVEMTLPFDDNGFVTMPPHMARILEVYDPAQRRLARYRTDSLTTDGRVILQLDRYRETTARSYRVKYVMDWERLMADTDLTPIPRHHNELVVIGVMLRMAKFTGDVARIKLWQDEYDRLLVAFVRDGTRVRRQQHQTMRARRIRSSVPTKWHPYTFGY